jgi:NAD-dependent SIR2 family protein deacetylase
MESADLKLDGNAIGGELDEIFAAEMTVARATCAACGAVWEMGALTVYAHAPGAVVRCVSCEAVLLRIVRADDRLWLDPSGVSCLELRMDL